MDDRYLWSRSELLDNITGFLGGRVAEEMIFNEITSGAQNDLERASDLARRMVTELGMSDRLGPITLGRRHGNPFLGRDLMEDRNYSEDVAKAIDEEVKSIMDDGYGRAQAILEENRDAMERVVRVLLERETIEREEFLALMRGEELPEEPTSLPEPPAPKAPAEREGEAAGLRRAGAPAPPEPGLGCYRTLDDGRTDARRNPSGVPARGSPGSAGRSGRRCRVPEASQHPGASCQNRADPVRAQLQRGPGSGDDPGHRRSDCGNARGAGD